MSRYELKSGKIYDSSSDKPLMLHKILRLLNAYDHLIKDKKKGTEKIDIRARCGGKTTEVIIEIIEYLKEHPTHIWMSFDPKEKTLIDKKDLQKTLMYCMLYLEKVGNRKDGSTHPDDIKKYKNLKEALLK